MAVIDPKRTKERMDERLAMMHKLYSDSEVRHIFSPSKPITNADRIRSMTDEELADVMRSPCDFVPHIPTEWCRNRSCGYQCALEWLKQEATDG